MQGRNQVLLSHGTAADMSSPSANIPSRSVGQKRQAPIPLSGREFPPCHKRIKPAESHIDGSSEYGVTPVARKIIVDKKDFKHVVHHFTGKHTLSTSATAIFNAAPPVQAYRSSCSCHSYGRVTSCDNTALVNLIYQSLHTLQAVTGYLLLQPTYDLPKNQTSVSTTAWKETQRHPAKQPTMENPSRLYLEQKCDQFPLNPLTQGTSTSVPFQSFEPMSLAPLF
ncbi:hypothetical protein KP509_36G045700 [Ceratopteris richardii]|uniref:VQ domain-containing protein n=1 Tax=Ceratopteris richardii TaxID=49495 RepID=A0A8T2QCP9_CERRI|nr:hypothetical protein KP509_36G045700 [Ceratopteris richardii]